MCWRRVGVVWWSQLPRTLVQLRDASQQVTHGFLKRLQQVLVSGRKRECSASTTMIESHAHNITKFVILIGHPLGFVTLTIGRAGVCKGLETEALHVWHGWHVVHDLLRQVLAASLGFPLGNHSCRVLESCTPITLHPVLQLLGIVLVLPRTESLAIQTPGIHHNFPKPCLLSSGLSLVYSTTSLISDLVC